MPPDPRGLQPLPFLEHALGELSLLGREPQINTVINPPVCERFAGIWVPLVTPFRHGAIDIPALRILVMEMVKSGIHGLVACGTTAEAAQLSEEEQVVVLTTILSAAGPGYPVLMGISGSDTAALVGKVQRFNRYPIAGFLVSAPCYVKPSQQGILLHFQAIANTSAYPIVLYNIPSRTGVNIELPTLIRLAGDKRFVAIKESSGDLYQLADSINKTTLQVLGGDDTLMLNTLASGGTGAISAAAHLRPDLYVRLYHSVRAGELAQAETLFNVMLPLIRLLFQEPNPAPVKAALAMHGRICEELRLPMTPVSAAHRQKLDAALEQIMVL